MQNLEGKEEKPLIERIKEKNARHRQSQQMQRRRSVGGMRRKWTNKLLDQDCRGTGYQKCAVFEDSLFEGKQKIFVMILWCGQKAGTCHGYLSSKEE